MKRPWLLIFVLFVNFSSCIPSESVELRDVEIRNFRFLTNNKAIISTKSNFYNPNSTRMRLKKIYLEIFIKGKKVGYVDEQLNEIIQPNSDFMLKTEIQLDFNETGLFSTVLSLFGSNKTEVTISGRAKILVHGLPIKIPFEIKEQFKF